LRFLLITSGAFVHLTDAHMPEDVIKTEVSGLFLKVNSLNYKKCERCWHRRKDVGSSEIHPTLCMRCVENVDGEGEVRRFV